MRRRLAAKSGRAKTYGAFTGARFPPLSSTRNRGMLSSLITTANTPRSAVGGRRRMFTMNLCQRYPEHRLEDLRNYISGGARFWVERAFSEKMMNTAGPERMRHLEQVMANDGHLAEMSRQARSRMDEPSRG